MRNAHIPSRLVNHDDLKPGLQLIAAEADCSFDRITLTHPHENNLGWWFESTACPMIREWTTLDCLERGRWRIPLNDSIKVMEFECATFTRNADGDIPIRFEGMETTATVALTTAQAKELVGKLQAAIDADPDEARKREMRLKFPPSLHANKPLVVTKRFMEGGTAYAYTIMWDVAERRVKHTSKQWPSRLTFSEVIDRLVEDAYSLDVTVLEFA